MPGSGNIWISLILGGLTGLPETNEVQGMISTTFKGEKEMHYGMNDSKFKLIIGIVHLKNMKNWLFF